MSTNRPTHNERITIDGVTYVVEDTGTIGVNGHMFILTLIGKRGQPVKLWRPAVWTGKKLLLGPY